MKTSTSYTVLLLLVAMFSLRQPLESAANMIRELLISTRATIAPGATLVVNGTLDARNAQSLLGLAGPGALMSVAHDGSLTGAGTAASPLAVVPVTLPEPGITTVVHDATLAGSGTTASPLSVVSVPGAGAGLTAVVHDATLSGQGTAAAPLSVVPKDVAHDSSLVGVGSEYSPLSVADRPYAIFEIPLGIYGSEWTDFELKGSIRNFSEPAEETLAYFYGSAYGAGISTHGQIGDTIEVYYTDDLNGTDHGSARKWRRQDRSKSLFQQKVGKVGGVIVVVHETSGVHESVQLLNFSYQRVSASTMEECWVPIVPKWVRYYPNPPN